MRELSDSLPLGRTDKTNGRPAGDVRKAVLTAAGQVAGAQGASMRELAEAACVGRQAAQYTVRNLVKAGLLHAVSKRREAYRNRPVYLYSLRAQQQTQNDFSGLVRVW